MYYRFKGYIAVIDLGNIYDVISTQIEKMRKTHTNSIKYSPQLK